MEGTRGVTACGVGSRDGVFPKAAVGGGLGSRGAGLAGSQIGTGGSVYKLQGIWPVMRGKFRKGKGRWGDDRRTRGVCRSVAGPVWQKPRGFVGAWRDQLVRNSMLRVSLSLLSIARLAKLFSTAR